MKVKPLLEAISMIAPAVDSKGLVQEFTFLYFNDKYVQATDGSLLIRAELADPAPEFTIGATVLHSLLRTVKDKEIEMVVEDNKLLLTTKKLKTELSLPAEKLDSTIDFDVEAWQEIPEGFIEGLELCRFTACPDQTAGPLTGVRVEGNSILSTDRWRISLFTLKEDTGIDIGITLPVSLIDQLSRFSKYIEGYAVKDSTIYFNLGTGIIGAQLVPGDYPTETLLQGVDMVDKASKLIISDELKKNISEAGKRQNIIQEGVLEFDRNTKFSVVNGNITLFAENKEVGIIEESLGKSDKEDCPDFEFFINPVFLLRTFEDTKWLLYAEEGQIAAFEGARFIHLVKTKSPVTAEDAK